MTHKLDVDRLVALHGEGFSVKAIARQFGVDHSAIRSRLVAGGVTLRSVKETMEANFARDPSTRDRMGAPRRWPIDETFFEKLTPDVAYVVGLMQADGYNNIERGAMRVDLKPSDAPLLNAVAAAMQCSRPLRVQRGPDGRAATLFLELNSRRLSAGLASWGVVSPKSHTASTHPVLLDDRDYWRGVIDGDGTLCNAATGLRILSLVGSQAICDQFLAFCRRRGAGLRCTVRPHKGIWSVHITSHAAVTIAAALYDVAGLALSRKQAVYHRWIQPAGDAA